MTRSQCEPGSTLPLVDESDLTLTLKTHSPGLSEITEHETFQSRAGCLQPNAVPFLRYSADLAD